MVRQWRVPAGRALLEIPAGTLDVHDGVTEDPDVAARRELEEETGHRAATLAQARPFWTAPGFASELMHLYLATDMAGVGTDDDRLAPDEDERLELRHVPLDEAIAMVDAGRDRRREVDPRHPVARPPPEERGALALTSGACPGGRDRTPRVACQTTNQASPVSAASLETDRCLPGNESGSKGLVRLPSDRSDACQTSSRELRGLDATFEPKALPARHHRDSTPAPR